MPPDRPEILYALLCEDIRVEADQKIALLGLWGGVVRVFANPPATLATLAAHSHVSLAATAGFKAHVEIRLPGGVPPFVHEVDLPAAAGDAASGQNLNLKYLNAPLLEAGYIDFIVRVDGPDGQTQEEIQRLRVVFEPQESE